MTEISLTRPDRVVIAYRCDKKLPWTICYGMRLGCLRVLDHYTTIDGLLLVLRSIPGLVNCPYIGMIRYHPKINILTDVKHFVSDITSDTDVMLTFLGMDD